MATDFFERQDIARRSTKWLIVLFALGVIGIVGGTFVIAWFAVGGMNQYNALQHPGAPDYRQQGIDPLLAALAASGGSLALVGGGSLFKVAQLRAGGGTSVAESLGAKRVYPNATDFTEQRLLNVVEEMALASGVPVPPVFLLADEQGINAFAAGYASGDAVVAVTRGCAEQLSREELQGVVAHEFSHILNGDMRLNIRLIGILHGILLLGLIGRILLRSTYFSRGSSRRNDGAWLLAIGLALLVLGFLGTLMGNLIKAAVSRQREYLADSSAVQFTRNPEGLAGALKRIGAAVFGSRLKAPNAAEASHMYFAQGLWEGFTSLTATHPPLGARIRRLDPQWNGKFPPAPKRPAVERELGPAAAGLVGAPALDAAPPNEVEVGIVSHAADQVGEPTELHRVYASELLQSTPPLVNEAVHEPYGARAVLYALLCDKQTEVRDKQLKRLAELAQADVYQLTLKLLPYVDLLDMRLRLPLVDMALPSLRAMSPSQYKVFLNCFQELVRADDRLGLFEWTLHRILLRHLRPQFERVKTPRVAYYGLQKLTTECATLLSTLAHADNVGAEAPVAFSRGAARLPGLSLQLLSPKQCSLQALHQALEKLSQTAPKHRRSLVDACAVCICADKEVTVTEAELLRGICDMLDCPMPPLLPGQPIP